MPDTDKLQEIVDLLRDIHSDQQKQLAHAEEFLDMQAEQLRMSVEQYERAAKLQQRAEEMQERGRQMMGKVHAFIRLAVIVVFILIIYVSWIVLRRGFH